MKRSKTEEKAFRELADRFSLQVSDISTIVSSFFGVILSESRSLPFNNPRKIYSKKAFADLSKIQNIPYLGRFGPSYTRYLKWRVNEAKGINMIPRQKTKKKLSQEEIEALAEIILKGGTYEPKKKVNNYKRVWLVGEDSKKLARQAIPKEENV